MVDNSNIEINYTHMRRKCDGQIFAYDYRYANKYDEFEYLVTNSKGKLVTKESIEKELAKDADKEQVLNGTENTITNTDNSLIDIEHIDSNKIAVMDKDYIAVLKQYTVKQLKDLLKTEFNVDLSAKVLSKDELIYHLRKHAKEQSDDVKSNSDNNVE